MNVDDLAKLLELEGAAQQIAESDEQTIRHREESVVSIETTFNVRFPDDFRWMLLHAPETEIRTRLYHSVDFDELFEVGCRLPMRPWTDQSRFIEYLDGFTVPGPQSDELRKWFPKLVPIGHDDGNGHNYLCYDYAFDEQNPPIVALDGEEGWVSWRKVCSKLKYVAPSFSAYLELTPCHSIEPDFYPETFIATLPVPEASERGLAWSRFREALVNSTKDPVEEFRKAVKGWRLYGRLTQADLAAATGSSKGQIGRLERGAGKSTLLSNSAFLLLLRGEVQRAGDKFWSEDLLRLIDQFLSDLDPV